jgi:iron(III) transport system substrate-binding protein
MRTLRSGLAAAAVLIVLAGVLPGLPGCHRGEKEEVVVYCGVDEPYASKVFQQFEQETGIHVKALYDIESSKSVGLSEKIRAEYASPKADVWWGSEAFLTVRMAGDGVLEPYRPPAAAEVPDQFKDPDGYWTGVGLRARVLAVAEGNSAPPFKVKGIEDLADPRLKNKVTISGLTAGATGAHAAALYVFWGSEKARAYFKRLHDNGIAIVGGNAVVADEVGKGSFSLGLTDSDDVVNTADNGGRLNTVVPDQDSFGTLAMPTTVALVKNGPHAGVARKLIDYLTSKQVEQKLIEMKFAGWSTRAGEGGAGQGLKVMPVDYKAAAKAYAQAQREATAILQGRDPDHP